MMLDMIYDFVYNFPTWVTLPATVGGSIFLSIVAMKAVTSVFSYEERVNHNELVGFNIAVVSVLYSVLLGFLAVSVWEEFGKTKNVVSRESSLVGDLYRDINVFPEPVRTLGKAQLYAYTQTVIENEWPAMANNIAPDAKAWEILNRFHMLITSAKWADQTQTAMFAEVLNRLNFLFDARRERLAAAKERLHGLVWGVIFLGALFPIGFTFLYGTKNAAMHMLMTGGVTGSLCLVMYLVIAIDFPFRGNVQISQESFEDVLNSMADPK